LFVTFSDGLSVSAFPGVPAKIASTPGFNVYRFQRLFQYEANFYNYSMHGSRKEESFVESGFVRELNPETAPRILCRQTKKRPAKSIFCFPLTALN
jgi:hypothetical protein